MVYELSSAHLEPFPLPADAVQNRVIVSDVQEHELQARMIHSDKPDVASGQIIKHSHIVAQLEQLVH